MHRPNCRASSTLWLFALTLVGTACLGLGLVACRDEVMPTTPAAAPTSTATLTATASPAPSLTGSPSATAVPTHTPRPTNTPRPARPIRKLGPEICAGTRVSLGNPPVVKLRNVSREYVGEVRQLVGPDCLIVIRFEFDQPDTRMDPRQAAREWFGRRREDMVAMRNAAAPNIAFETAVNECPEDLLDWYVEFSLQLIPLMHAEGLRCVAGNPGVGQWSEEGWPRFRPVIAILRPDDFVGLHEYWVDTPDIGNRWHCGRWTIPAIAAVIGDARIVITECGRDVVEGRGQPGWRRTCNTEDFLWDLEEYDALLRQFPNVVGATVFTLDPGWKDFDVTSLWPQVVFRYSLTPTPVPPGS